MGIGEPPRFRRSGSRGSAPAPALEPLEARLLLSAGSPQILNWDVLGAPAQIAAGEEAPPTSEAPTVLIQHELRGSLVDDLGVADMLLTRPSTAFLGGIEYAPDAARYETVPVCSPSDGVARTQDQLVGGGFAHVIPFKQFQQGGVLWGFGYDTDNVYTSVDGDVWELQGAVNSGDGHILSFGWSLRDGRSSIVWRSLAGSKQTWRVWLDDNGDLHSAHCAEVASRGALATEGLYQREPAEGEEYGTILFCDRGDTGGKTYRSADNGQTWQDVYTTVSPQKHVHNMRYHAATEKWVMVTGDSLGRSICQSDDDGLSWTPLVPNYAEDGQWVGMLDYGHPTDMLLGSDSDGEEIVRLNVLTGRTQPVSANLIKGKYKHHVFSFGQHEGVIYACATDYSSDGSDRDLAILVSTNVADWSVYHRLPLNTETWSIYFAGVCGGHLHFRLNVGTTDEAHLVITPAAVLNRASLAIDPATENLLGSPDSSSFEAGLGGWSYWGTVALDPDKAVHGANALRVERQGDQLRISMGPIPIPTGASRPSQYAASYMTSCSTVVPYGANSRYNWARWAVKKTDGSVRYVGHYFKMSSEEMRSITVPSFVVESDDESFWLLLYGERWSSQYLGGEVWFDCVQLETGDPSRWQLGGTPRQTELATFSADMPEAWTSTFGIRSEVLAGDLRRDSRILIRSWAADDDNHADLYFDTTDYSFRLAPTVAGVEQDPIETAAGYLFPGSVVWFAVRFEASGLRLSVANGRPFEHASGAPCPALCSSSVTTSCGDNAFGEVLSMCLFDDRVLLGAPGDAVIEQTVGRLCFPTVTLSTVNDGASQRSVISSASCVFSQPVVVDQDALRIRNETTGQEVELPLGLMVYDDEARTATWDLSSVALSDGDYVAAVCAELVTDADGNPLDGDCDGRGGGDCCFAFHVLRGDFSGDAALDADDIDLLFGEINAGTHTPCFDLTADGQVNQADADELVTGILGTWYGDANLDGCVDGADYTAWADRYGQAGGWGEGDSTGNGFVDGADYTAWADNYGRGVRGQADAPAAGSSLSEASSARPARFLPIGSFGAQARDALSPLARAGKTPCLLPHSNGLRPLPVGPSVARVEEAVADHVKGISGVAPMPARARTVSRGASLIDHEWLDVLRKLDLSALKPVNSGV